jgi:hypothetical protein
MAIQMNENQCRMTIAFTYACKDIAHLDWDDRELVARPSLY